MQTGVLSFSVSFLWLVASGAVTEAPVSVEEHIHASVSLCAGEQEYVDRRKTVVQESLHHLGINCSADEVPHVALLPSGGGQRAAVALMGSLDQMAKDGLLDSLLYLGGVSGSTWSMSTLYSDPQWSRNMDRAVASLTGPWVELQRALAWLDEKSKTELFSLSDVWGLLTSAGIMKQMDLRHLSKDTGGNATNPYPVYSAVEQEFVSDGPIEGRWFEMTPHEAGFTELGLFVKTSLLDSKFQSGQLLEQRPEMDMIQLQGILGSALAGMDSIRDVVPSWLKVDEHVDSAVEEYFAIYTTLNYLVHLIRGSTADPAGLAELDALQGILEGMLHVNRSTVLQSAKAEDRKAVLQQWRAELLASIEAWTHSQEHEALKACFFVLIQRVIPLIIRWEWGTTRNFLYQRKDVPPSVGAKENLNLVDAGLAINVAYPPFLGEKRDMDLLVIAEYSAGLMFQTLIQARDYAAALKKPFPAIDDKILEERAWPQDCYVFEGKGKEPTIVYMPLFNRRNCKDAEEVEAKMKEFTTFQLPFSEANIKSLLETSSTNMKNNKETLLRELSKAVLRRRNKR